MKLNTLLILVYFADTKDLKNRLQQMFEDLSDKVDLHPAEFVPAITSMLNQFDNIHTDVTLTSALHSFGKYTGAGTTLKKRSAVAKQKAIRCLQERRGGGTGGHRLELRGTGQIGVQPTATARRRPHMGRGARRLPSGRPCKSSYVAEHGYGKSSSQDTSSVLPVSKRRKQAPHSLSYTVAHGTSLGKTHSIK